ncbi:MAG TPA: hypothetical protein VGM64_07895 [Lacunisphaera sp.]|jgi:hypothetical protein
MNSGRENSTSARTGTTERRFGAPFFFTPVAHGDEPATTVTGRGMAKASSWTGAGNGTALDHAGELPSRASRLVTPTDDLFNTSPFDFRSGAGQDLAESDDACDASLTFVGRKN